MLLGPRAGDLVTEPRDHVGRRGTLRIGRPGERPRRRRIVPAGHRGEPLRLAHRARSFELVEGTQRVGRGPDPATRAAHAEPAGFDDGHVDRGDGRWRLEASPSRLQRPRDREQTDADDAHDANASGQPLRPRQRRDDRRQHVVRVRVALRVGVERDRDQRVLGQIQCADDHRQGDDEPLTLLQRRRLAQWPPSTQHVRRGERVADDQHAVGGQRTACLAEVVAAATDPVLEAPVGTRELGAPVEVAARRRGRGQPPPDDHHHEPEHDERDRPEPVPRLRLQLLAHATHRDTWV